MTESLEELANREIDDLYRQALFLHGGEEDRAEALLLGALAEAFSSVRAGRGGDSARRALQERLVIRFLDEEEEIEAEETRIRIERGWRGPFNGLRVEMEGGHPGDARGLCRAARALPKRARAAIWLVLFGRWPFEEAARILEGDVEELQDLLRYRHTLLAELLGGIRWDPKGEIAG